MNKWAKDLDHLPQHLWFCYLCDADVMITHRRQQMTDRILCCDCMFNKTRNPNYIPHVEKKDDKHEF